MEIYMIDDYNIQMPGRIVEYDATTQLAVVRISNDKTYSNSGETDRQVKRVLLRDVPVHTPSGGNWAMTFPINTGDSCLINFSQFGYDHWLYNDEDSAGIRSDGQPQTWTERRFSLRDGFAQVGYNTIPKAIADYSADDSEWRNVDRTVRITLADAGVNIVAGATTITITKDGDVTVTAPTTAIVGDMTVSGKLDVVGKVTGGSGEFAGISSEGHTHTEQGDGNEVSPPN
jgi:phage baseplate assembly protein gpV